MTYQPLRASKETRMVRFTPRSEQRFEDENSHEAYNRGKKEAMAECEQAWSATIDALTGAARNIKEEARIIERRAVERAAEFIARVVVEAAPAITLVSARQAIHTLLEKRAEAANSGTIVVKANAAVLEALHGRLDEKTDLSALCFEEDPALGPTCVTAQWRDGSVKCDLEDATRGIVKYLEQSAPPPERNRDDTADDS